MSNFFDIDNEEEYLTDFAEDFEEKYLQYESLIISLDNQPITENSILPLVGTVNTLKSNAGECQNIPLASALDSLENILSHISQLSITLPGNFSELILAIFEIAKEMSTQAAEIQKVDFDLFSKIQNALQPLSTCEASNIHETLNLSIALLEQNDDTSQDNPTKNDIDLFDDDPSNNGVDLFSDDPSNDGIDLFDDAPPATSQINSIQQTGGPIFVPTSNKRYSEDLQAFRLLADEADTDSMGHKPRMDTILYLARFMNAIARNPIDANQLEAAVYLYEMMPLFKNNTSQLKSKFTLIPTAPGWELATSIVVFMQSPLMDAKSLTQTLGTQIRNGVQILRICQRYYDLSCKNNNIEDIKNIITQMDNEFSTFWITVFLRVVDKVTVLLNKNNSPKKEISPKKILCIDDDSITLTVFEHMLEKAGHIPITVDNYDDAINLINKIPPDLILLDMNMPNKGGYWLIEERKGNPVLSDIPIAVISGSEEDYGINEDEVVGIYQKPISKDTLLEIIEKACG